MGQFDRQIQTALRLIKKNGQVISWIQKPEITPDITKPWIKVSGDPVTFNPVICFLPLDLEGKKFLMSIGVAPEALTGTYYGLMGNVNFDPNKIDTVVRDGVSLNIASIDLLSPNGQKILYTVVFNG